MLAVLLVGCVVFDWTLAIEYKDFDDDSATYDDEASRAVDEMARVRRDDQETLSPEKIREALKEIMPGRIFDNNNEDTSIISPAFTKIEYYDNPTRSTRIEYYESLQPLTRIEYESLNNQKSMAATTNKYDENYPKPIRTLNSNITPSLNNQKSMAAITKRYDENYPVRTENSNITPLTKMQIDFITNNYGTHLKSNYSQTIVTRTSTEIAVNMNKFNEIDTDVTLTKVVYEYDNVTDIATMLLSDESTSDAPKPSRTGLPNKDALVNHMTGQAEENSYEKKKKLRQDYDDSPSPEKETTAAKPATATPTMAKPTITSNPKTANTNTANIENTSPTTDTISENSTATTNDSTFITTPLTTSTKQIKFDIDKFLEIVANLTYDYYTNLTDQVNDTLRKMKIPTCGTPTTTEGTTTQYTGPDYDAMSKWLMGKCFVCGLEDPGIPYNANCADAFAGDFIPLVPIDPTAKGQLSRYRKYCRYLDVDGYKYNNTMPLSIFGRWTGGCAVRWTDLSGVYTQRVCRNRYYATTGKHYASKRMAKLEMALQYKDNGCIISPSATLLPLSRGISLFARFHACVCTGSWCNRTSLHSGIDVWTVLVIAMTAVILS